MSFAPYAALWAALVVAAGICLVAGRRWRLLTAVIFATSLLSIASWLLFRPGAVPPSLSISGRQWAIGDVAWSLTGVVLLLLLTAAVRAVSDRHRPNPARQAALALALTAAALPPIWAADGRTQILGVATFAVVVGLAGWLLPSEGESRRGASPVARRLIFAIFPMWAAVALPEWQTLWLILAAGILVGVWPFDGRRRDGDDFIIGIMSAALPVVVGAAVLATVIHSGLPSSTDIAVGTGFGLLSLAISLGRVWARPAELASALGLGLSGLVLVVAIWAGVEAMIPAVQLAVFAPALLSLAVAGQRSSAAAGEPISDGEGGSPSRFHLSPQRIALVALFLAVAGLPLTVGFNALGALYESWRAAGGWLLLLVMILLLGLWLAAVVVRFRSSSRDAVTARGDWLRAAALLPAVIGLLGFNFIGLGVNVLTWIALAIPPIAGLLLGRFAPDAESISALLAEATAMPPGITPIVDRLRQIGRTIADAAADALTILEGEYSLLWLLGLLLLLLWIA